MLAAVCNHFTRATDGQSLSGSGNVCNSPWINGCNLEDGGSPPPPFRISDFSTSLTCNASA
jgi:hypothetical protein